MNQARNYWGVEFNGADEDKRAWRMLLKLPYDPFVEEVKDERGDYLALRSATFDGDICSAEVYDLAKRLFRTLNVVMSKNADTDPVTIGAVVEFVPDGQPRKHHFLKAESGLMRLRGSLVNIIVTDSQGNLVEPPPAPSRAQLWMRAATLNPDIGSALRYLEGKSSWFELYKAYEAVRQMPNGGISGKKIGRFKQTANAEERHLPGIFESHRKPMELWEAHAMITQWVSAAIEDILTKNP